MAAFGGKTRLTYMLLEHVTASKYIEVAACCHDRISPAANSAIRPGPYSITQLSSEVVWGHPNCKQQGFSVYVSIALTIGRFPSLFQYVTVSQGLRIESAQQSTYYITIWKSALV